MSGPEQLTREESEAWRQRSFENLAPFKYLVTVKNKARCASPRKATLPLCVRNVPTTLNNLLEEIYASDSTLWHCNGMLYSSTVCNRNDNYLYNLYIYCLDVHVLNACAHTHIQISINIKKYISFIYPIVFIIIF